MNIEEQLNSFFKAKKILKTEVIQKLWSGYGEILRYKLTGASISSVIVKHINLDQPNLHPRGWNTNNSHLRKIKSYQVEQEWYENLAKKCDLSCKIPKCYFTIDKENEQLIVLEDLDISGFMKRRSSLSINESKVVLNWLANFHARFIQENPNNLWQEGSYWHLETRLDELNKMKNGKLKEMAVSIDLALKGCHFQTLIHGDAKVANFCFSEDMKSVGAVDFQYVGRGCGMKDVSYFLGSCLTEQACENYESELLDHYFNALEISLNKQYKVFDFKKLELEWRKMYVIAWADFTRFLMGWMPTHQKVNGYSLKMVERAFQCL